MTAALCSGITAMALLVVVPAVLAGCLESRAASEVSGGRSGTVQIPAGVLRQEATDVGPTRSVARRHPVKTFWMDRTEVTNQQFEAFVIATGYITTAERQGGGAVFRVPSKGFANREASSWWFWVPGASWRHPEGPGSALTARRNFPVVMVSYADAMAYAKWRGGDLPTEVEWEYAARGGGRAEVIGRQPRDASGAPTANFWQGVFPYMNTASDGYVSLAPVGCFAANGYGLSDMIGNVWEFTRDAFDGERQRLHLNGDPGAALPRAGTQRHARGVVIKGGSFLCSEDYCAQYRSTARERHELDVSASHVGFRVVYRQ